MDVENTSSLTENRDNYVRLDFCVRKTNNESNDSFTRLRSTNHINQSKSDHSKFKNVKFKTNKFNLNPINLEKLFIFLLLTHNLILANLFINYSARPLSWTPRGPTKKFETANVRDSGKFKNLTFQKVLGKLNTYCIYFCIELGKSWEKIYQFFYSNWYFIFGSNKSKS